MPTQEKKTQIAEEMLKWFEERQVTAIRRVYEEVIIPFSGDTGHEVFNCWKAWHLLRDFGRVQGKYSKTRVVNYSPLQPQIDYNKNQPLLKLLSMLVMNAWGYKSCKADWDAVKGILPGFSRALEKEMEERNLRKVSDNLDSLFKELDNKGNEGVIERMVQEQELKQPTIKGEGFRLWGDDLPKCWGEEIEQIIHKGGSDEGVFPGLELETIVLQASVNQLHKVVDWLWEPCDHSGSPRKDCQSCMTDFYDIIRGLE